MRRHRGVLQQLPPDPPHHAHEARRVLRTHQTYYNKDDYNSNELEELRRKQQNYRNDSKSCSKSLQEHCRNLFVAALVALSHTLHYPRRRKASDRRRRSGGPKMSIGHGVFSLKGHSIQAALTFEVECALVLDWARTPLLRDSLQSAHPLMPSCANLSVGRAVTMTLL